MSVHSIVICPFVSKYSSKMTRKYELDEKRWVIVKKHEVVLLQDGTNKKAVLSYSRWASLLEQVTNVDDALEKVVKKTEEVELQQHIGAGWHVSVTSGIFCIDIRRFYMTVDGKAKPTREGFAFRIREWSRFRQLVEVIKQQNQKLAEAQPCWTQTDHYNQEGAIQCPECSFYMLATSADMNI